VLVRELLEQLEKIVEVHPEANESTVWADSVESGHRFQIKNVGYDKRHKPNRVKLGN
jgi:hypothetical protein